MKDLSSLKPIKEIASNIGVPDNFIQIYGDYTAKLKLDLLEKKEKQGKLILVTAITPTMYGEGKTVISIGLSQGINRIGKKSIVTLREPSLGPVFGTKGGATGGGKSKVRPCELINLHFNGDFHAVTSAHNLLAAMIDSHLHHGNDLRIDPDSISWTRALDMNDRALRHIVIGLGGKLNGVPRETGFVITAASEIMAILALSSSFSDLRERLKNIAIGFDKHGKIIRAEDIHATGAMLLLLNQAIMPNLVQTTENTPAIIHAGPFANIAHGTSSIISQKIGLNYSDYVVNECGFAADLGAEKYFDIVMPKSGIKPSAVVVVATVKALLVHGSKDAKMIERNSETIKRGFSNLDKHLANLKKFNVTPIVAINRFPDDTDTELNLIAEHCKEIGIECSVADVFAKGGEGAIDLAEKVVRIADGSDTNKVSPLYNESDSLTQKINTVATEIYGADGVYYESGVKKKLEKLTDIGFGSLPVCIAKTQSSLSDNPKLTGAPRNWTLTVSNAFLSAGAGFVVVVAGNMMLMPGLSKTPQALNMNVDDAGNLIGLD